MPDFRVPPIRAQLEFSRLPCASSTVFMSAELRISPVLDLRRSYAYSRALGHELLPLRQLSGNHAGISI